MTDTMTQTIAVYDAIAKEYAQTAEPKLDIKELDEFSNGLLPGGEILDVGCGSGRDTAYLASKGFRVTGIDLSKNLLAEARTLHPGLDFRRMDIRKLDFHDNSFDGIFAAAVLLHLKRTEVLPVLTEFSRVLKPGGVLFASVKEGVGEAVVQEAVSNNLGRFFTYFSMSEMKSLLTNAGFRVQKIYQKKSRSRDLVWIVTFSKK